VVARRPEPVDRPAEQTELHAHLDQQRQVAEGEGLEAGDRCAGVVLTAVRDREGPGPGAGPGQLAAPLQDQVAVGLAVQPVGLLEPEVHEQAAGLLAYLGVGAVEQSLQLGGDLGVHDRTVPRALVTLACDDYRSRTRGSASSTSCLLVASPSRWQR
jgi:hypothetical protein